MRSLSFVLYLSLCVKLSFSLFHHFLFRLHILIPIYSPFCFRKLCVCVSIRVLIFLSLHSERLSKKCQQLLNRQTDLLNGSWLMHYKHRINCFHILYLFTPSPSPSYTVVAVVIIVHVVSPLQPENVFCRQILADFL